MFPGGSDGKVSCLQWGRPGFDPWVGKILWRRKWQPTPVLLPGKSHGQRRVVGYSPWGHKESDTTEWLHFQTMKICQHFCIMVHIYNAWGHIWVFYTQDYSLPDSSGQGILQARILEWVPCSLLQEIFPTQGSNPGLPHCRQILFHLSHQGSPRILEYVAYLFSRVSSRPRNQPGVSCIAGRFLTPWATREALIHSIRQLWRCQRMNLFWLILVHFHRQI